MMTMQGDGRSDSSFSQALVCVIIAAKNASSTIACAIASALSEPEVVEIVVVDDGSADDTGAVAATADDGSGRLRIYRLESNEGPSFARNFALARSSAPIVSILDADDFFIPGRFSKLLASSDWDLAADNIVFVDQHHLKEFRSSTIASFKPKDRLLDLETFVNHNISRRNKARGELGFLKPVIRREFLDRHQLRYDETLRLGEDYDLYTRALAAGARFKIISHCGYGAVVRNDSLSGRHGTADLEALADADLRILKIQNLSEAGRRAISAHERHVREKFHHRRVLDIKASDGLRGCITYAYGNPRAVLPVAAAILRDKFGSLLRRTRRPDTGQSTSGLRYLFAAQE
jgi:succinoglycan biosynthesis protein ExoU